jgi:imidazole glycerol-phosphate synthase subunit HisH
MIVIIDYGLGNLASIQNMIRKAAGKSLISSNPDQIAQAEKIILPGVGSFDNGMKNLRELNLITLLNKKVLEDKTPLLGICLGMQLLANKSAEGILPGLGFIAGEVVKFRAENGVKLHIPHMGWNDVKIVRKHKLVEKFEEETRFYFVHSYHIICKNNADVLTQTFYGGDFTSAVARENIMGTQFHPEKSHKFGLQLFKNFIEM